MFKRMIAFSLTLAILLGCTCALADAQLYEQAKKELASGQLDEALQSFAMAGNYEDASQYMLYIRSIQIAEAGYYDLATESFRSLNGFYDSQLMAQYYTARQSEANEDYEQAAEYYRAIVAFKDSFDRLLSLPEKIKEREFKRAQALMEIKAYQDALPILIKLEDHPGAQDALSECYYQLALVRKAEGLTQNAYDLLNKVPNYKDAAQYLTAIETAYADAMLLQADGQWEAAATAFKALNDYSDSPQRARDCYWSNAEALMALGDENSAIEALKKSGYRFTSLVIQKEATGFQSNVKVNVTVGIDGLISEVIIDSADETQGFGTKLSGNAEFAAQFVGKAGPFELGKGGIDTYSGATVTSRAVVNAVNQAMANLPVPPLYVIGGTSHSEAQGFQSTVKATVTVNSSGVITEIKLFTQNETEYFGMGVGESDWAQQFVGKTGPFEIGKDGIDAYSGATYTSKAAVKAINDCLQQNG